MNNTILSFARPSYVKMGWSNRELAEFYRVEAFLLQAGISVDTDAGFTDEGEPWFVFCDLITSDVIVHFARVSGRYLIAGPAFPESVRGRDFGSLIGTLLDHYPTIVPKRSGDRTLFIHPAAMLLAIVATCFFKVSQANAMSSHESAARPIGNSQDINGSDAVPIGSAAADGGAAAESLILAAIVASARAYPVDMASPDSQEPFALQLSSQGSGVVASAELGGLADLFLPVHSAELMTQVSIDISDPQLDVAVHDLLLLKTAQSIVVDAKDFSAVFLARSESELLPQDSSSLIIQQTDRTSFASGGRDIVQVPPNAVDHDTGGKKVDLGVNQTETLAQSEIQKILNNSVLEHINSDFTGRQERVLAAFSGPATAVSIIPQQAATRDSNVVPTSFVEKSENDQIFISLADAAISKFIVGHKDYMLLNEGGHIILYDPHLTADNVSSAVHLELDFFDGSSIFLIGLSNLGHNSL